MSKSRKAALCGMLTALCFLLSYVEMLLPLASSRLPGAKAGLANICVLYALYSLGFWYAAAINAARVLLAWLFFGNAASLAYSFAGAVLSLAVEALLIKTSRFSEVGVSAAGGAAHNLGQLAAAVLLLGQGALGYLPVLLIGGTAAGAVNGVILKMINRQIGKSQSGGSPGEKDKC